MLFYLDIVHYNGQTSAAFSGYAAPAVSCGAQSGIFQPTYGENGGVADSLDEAKAAFRRAWDAPPDVMTMTGATGTVAQGWGAPHGEG